MVRKSEFLQHVIETLRAFGEVEARPMFGGWTLRHEGHAFALVFEDALYFKGDAENAAEFDARGLDRFVFESRRTGEKIETAYRAAPEEAFEDPRVMAEWARRGYGAALRASRAPRRKRSRSARAPRS